MTYQLIKDGEVINEVADKGDLYRIFSDTHRKSGYQVEDFSNFEAIHVVIGDNNTARFSKKNYLYPSECDMFLNDFAQESRNALIDQLRYHYYHCLEIGSKEDPLFIVDYLDEYFVFPELTPEEDLQALERGLGVEIKEVRE